LDFGGDLRPARDPHVVAQGLAEAGTYSTLLETTIPRGALYAHNPYGVNFSSPQRIMLVGGAGDLE